MEGELPAGYKIPHIGWNGLLFKKDNPLFRYIKDGDYVYFVHSFSAQRCNPAQVIAATDYGVDVVAAVQNNNFFGCQFHPEKSGDVGLQILKNFGELNK